MDAAEFAELSAVEVSRRVLAGEVQAGEVVAAALDRLADVDPLVRAFVEVRDEQARADARRVDQRLRSGERPRLAGVPVGLKKTTTAAGAAQARRLVAAGCVVVGVTSVPLPTTPWQTWGHTERGPTRNPWRPSVVAGGSSAGSAAAVATGIVPLATGSDGAGSVRIPAAWCGVVGLKATNGAVPAPDAAGLTAFGAFGRTVADAAVHLDVVTGTDTLAGLDDEPRGLRVAWSDSLGFNECDPRVAAVARCAADVLADAGVTVPATSSARSAPAVTLRDPDQAWLALRGGDRAAAERTRRHNDRQLAELFDRVDLLVTPTTPVPPHGHEGPGAVMSVGLTWAFNLSGHPATSVPAGFTGDGLPVGLQLVAAHGREDLLLRTAAALERRAPWPRWTDRTARASPLPGTGTRWRPRRA